MQKKKFRLIGGRGSASFCVKIVLFLLTPQHLQSVLATLFGQTKLNWGEKCLLRRRFFEKSISFYPTTICCVVVQNVLLLLLTLAKVKPLKLATSSGWQGCRYFVALSQAPTNKVCTAEEFQFKTLITIKAISMSLSNVLCCGNS